MSEVVRRLESENEVLARLAREVDALKAIVVSGGSPLGTDVYRSTSQSIPSSTVTLVSYDTEVRDDEGLWDAGTPTRLTVPSDGVWLVTCGVTWALATGGLRQTGLRRNGTYIALDGRAASPTFETIQQVVKVRAMSAGDYIDVALYQDTGAALNVTANSYSTWLAAWRL